MHKPDSGRLVLHGQEVSFPSPRDAIKAGIAAVHQERNLIPRFSVAENLMLERLPKVRGLVDFAAVEREEIAILSEFVPQGLSEAELDAAIRDAIGKTGAAGAKDMGKVIASLKADNPGRIDFGKASARVKAALG